MREAPRWVLIGVYAVALGMGTVFMLGWLLGKEPKLGGWTIRLWPAPTALSSPLQPPSHPEGSLAGSPAGPSVQGLRGAATNEAEVIEWGRSGSAPTGDWSL
jgi:hypothetical protein